MNFKDILVWFLILLAVGLTISYIQNPSTLDPIKNALKFLKSDSMDLKEFNQNPESFVGKNISVTGKYENYFVRESCLCTYGTTLVSDMGYELAFCPIGNPNFRFEVGRVYTLHGIIEKCVKEEYKTITSFERINVTYYALIEKD